MGLPRHRSSAAQSYVCQVCSYRYPSRRDGPRVGLPPRGKKRCSRRGSPFPIGGASRMAHDSIPPSGAPRTGKGDSGPSAFPLTRPANLMGSSFVGVEWQARIAAAILWKRPKRGQAMPGKKRYTVSNGKMVLHLQPAEEGGYIVTSPLDP